jgi:CHASE3 domain sensor protein
MSFLSRFRGNVIAFPLAALAALAMLAISEASYRDATSSLDRLGERTGVRAHLNELVKSLLEAETGQRGYLLTERPEYLKPYEKGLSDSQAELDWLNAYYAKHPKADATMAEITRESEAKLTEMATTLQLRQRSGGNNWRDVLLSDIGREKMEHVRALSQQLIDYESSQVTVGRRSVYQTLWLNRIGVSAMAALSLLALFMYLRQTATLDRALAVEADRMASERDRLEQEVAARTAQLKELAQHLQTIREDERSRRASCTTSSGPCSRPPSSTLPASSHASAPTSARTRPSGWPTSTRR